MCIYFACCAVLGIDRWMNEWVFGLSWWNKVINYLKKFHEWSEIKIEIHRGNWMNHENIVCEILKRWIWGNNDCDWHEISIMIAWRAKEKKKQF